MSDQPHPPVQSVHEYRGDVIERLGNIETDMRRLVTAVIGEEEYGTTGLIKRMRALELKVEKNERRNVFVAGIWAAVTTLFSAFAAWWAGHK